MAGVLHSPRAGSQPVRSVRGGCRPLPERKGQQPVTAGRGTHDEGDAVGRAAALNGRAAGDMPGWEGVRVLRSTPYVLDEVAAMLGVHIEYARELARPHRDGIRLCNYNGRARWRQTYEVQGINELARARMESTCPVCTRPCRHYAYTCGHPYCVNRHAFLNRRARAGAAKGKA